MKLFKSFEEKFRKILGDEFEELLKFYAEGSKQCIRTNTLKISSEELKKRLEEKGWKLEPVPWYEKAFFLQVGENISKTLEYFLGYYFIQDASSLVPPLVLNPLPGESVLDLCAAPGSKTTFMVELMKNEGLIVAVDINPKRLKALSFNLQKIGAMNVIVLEHDGRKPLDIEFDKVLVDAPCSGSGTLKISCWGEKILSRLSNVQKQLLKSASQMVKKDGCIVYSTCSIDPEENEAVVDFAVKKLGLEVEEVEVPGLNYRKGLKEYGKFKFSNEVEKCIRFYPFDNKTEGFFVCKLRK
ncbi:MAG: RsmB/NOP family class I SAM-dependent RNA methyltransferase [Candidatus Aenigmatarchaeota archaeon]